MVNCGVSFEVRTKFLSAVYTGFGFKGLIISETVGVTYQLKTSERILLARIQMRPVC
jgi:hypothetical protein